MFLFLDESGTDHRMTPYEVIGGIVLPQHGLWPYVLAVKDAQRRRFGGLLHDLAPGFEPKGTRLLGRDKFRKASWRASFGDEERQSLCRSLFDKNRRGERTTAEELAALGQACLGYAEDVLEAAFGFGARVFATLVTHHAPQSIAEDYLRRDLTFLFERYFYFLEDAAGGQQGLIVFDDVGAQCSRRLRQVDGYFLRTRRGQGWSSRIIPEPFFVRSDLTTGVQTADLVIYVLNWWYRFGDMAGPTHDELRPWGEIARRMIYRTSRTGPEGRAWDIWSVTYLEDLRPATER